MQVNSVQLFALAQSLIFKIRTNIEISRNASAFRNQYKKARGLKKSATMFDVLRDLRDVCNEANIPHIFNDATKRYPEIVAQL